MSNFEVKIVKIDAIEPIDGADAIELAKIADYRSVVKKGQFKEGSLAVYIPEGAVVPDWLLKVMNIEGKLAGSAKNRVKSCKLRGCLSQGLLLTVESGSTDDKVLVISEPHDGNHGAGIHAFGDNIAEALGIIKYSPTIPTHMAGEVCNIGSENTINYDIENIKSYPNIIKEETEVVVLEKLHGSNCCLGYVPNLNNEDLLDGNKFAASKGLGAKGLVFKNNERNANNIYVKAFHGLTKNGKDIFTQYETYLNVRLMQPITEPLYLLGEVFGKGVQDLTYGYNDQQFRLFDIYLGKPGQGRYLNFDEKQLIAKELEIEMVPLLYKGPYSREKMDELVSGSTVEGNGVHMREGIVITPAIEERNGEIGRTILKHVSEQYLLRKDKNATEFN